MLYAYYCFVSLFSPCAFSSNEISSDMPPSYLNSVKWTLNRSKILKYLWLCSEPGLLILLENTYPNREIGKNSTPFYCVDLILFEVPLLPLKIKCISLLWQLNLPVKQWLTWSKSKSLDSEANYFVVVSRTHLLFELACLENKNKCRQHLSKGKREVGIWSNVYTTCYHKGCELNGFEMLRASEI